MMCVPLVPWIFTDSILDFWIDPIISIDFLFYAIINFRKEGQLNERKLKLRKIFSQLQYLQRHLQHMFNLENFFAKYKYLWDIVNE